MKPICSRFLPKVCIIVVALLAASQAAAQVDLANRTIHYTLLNGSYVLDDCLICGRPSIYVPIHGGFDLKFGADTNSFTVLNLSFSGSQYTGSGSGDGALSNNGTQQDWHLQIEINNGFTNEVRSYTNITTEVKRPLPMIYVVVSQLNSTFTHRYEVGLAAAPLKEIWFSLEHDLVASAAPPGQMLISRGDVISLDRIIKRGADLIAPFAPTDPFADVGTDALEVRPGGEIYFSSNDNFSSGTLGAIGNGDLLSDKGAVIARNSELMSAFQIGSGEGDVGLDAVRVGSEEVLFSIGRSVVSGKIGALLGRGDLLSSKGEIIKTGQQLISALNPFTVDGDYGLDALYIWPSGEIWFSVNDPFGTPQGQVDPGDIVSDQGYIVFKNRDLVSNFAPAQPDQDYGLDALWIVTDLTEASAPIRFTKIELAAGKVNLTWEGPAGNYQVESSTSVTGPYTPASPVVDGFSWSDTTVGQAEFYRLKKL